MRVLRERASEGRICFAWWMSAGFARIARGWTFHPFTPSEVGQILSDAVAEYSICASDSVGSDL